jgi:hypothetical protein
MSTSDTAFVEQLRHVLRDSRKPFLADGDHPDILIDDDIRLSTDVITQAGKADYDAYTKQWTSSLQTQCVDSRYNLLRVSTLVGDTKYVANWNVTFVPDAVAGIAFFSRLIPGWRLQYFDILAKEREISVFSWAKFRQFLWTAVTTGRVSLPYAVIVGQTEFTFQKSGGTSNGKDSKSENGSPAMILVEQREKLDLVRSLDSGILKNRKLANDLRTYLDIVKPPTIGLNEWDDILVRRLDFRAVPGMNPLDVDGLQPEQQENLLQNSSRLLSVATGAVLFFGIIYAIIVLNKVLLYQQDIADPYLLQAHPSIVDLFK